jgi:uncharacterized membrane protein
MQEDSAGGSDYTWPCHTALCSADEGLEGSPMYVIAMVRVIAVVSAGLKAGIFLGHRAGPQYALQKLSPSGFVQFQQVVHAHFVRFMPPLTVAALVSAVIWLVSLRSLWTSAEFWLVAAASCGLLLSAVMTRAVNVPLNNKLMTWRVDAPPDNLRELWKPWDRVNHVRTFLATGAVIFEAVALNLRTR